MIVFAIFGLCAILIAGILKQEDKRKHYGLEESNIKRAK